MRRLYVFIGVLLIASLFAMSAAAQPANRNFVANLNAGEEVADPPVESNARGQAKFQLNKDGDELSFRLIVANIENVNQAHIHIGPAGTNGPVIVWLYPESAPPQLIPGRTDGILATGVITEDDFVAPFVGEPFEFLIDAMRAGNAYVNVHTEQYPAGEVRGQIR